MNISLKKMKYVVYIRVSTQAQGQSHLGLDAQLKECKSYIDKRSGKLLKVYEEVKSGSHQSVRPIVMEAIEHSKREQAILLVARLDRLGRSQAFLTFVRQSGVLIESVEHGKMSTMLFGIYAAIAEHERELISKRTKDGLAQARKNGVQLGRRDWGDAAVKPNARRKKVAEEHNQGALQILIDSRRAGETYSTIASKLERYNFRTQSGSVYSEVRLRQMMSKYNKGLLERATTLVVEDDEAAGAQEDGADHADEDQEGEGLPVGDSASAAGHDRDRVVVGHLEHPGKQKK